MAAADPKKVEPEVEIEVVELVEVVASSIAVVVAASVELAAGTDPLT